MDQLKTALAQAKRYHFWILCGVIAVVGLGSWYMTQASLHTEFEANKGEIETTYTTAGQLTSQANPPNPIVHQGMDLRIRDLQQNVMEVWKNQYDHQKTTILAWPVELTARFKRAVEPLRPIEAHFNVFPTPSEKEILTSLRQEYANYIEDELPKLAKVIGARWEATAPAGNSFGDGAGGTFGGPTAFGPTPSFGDGGAYGAAGQDGMAKEPVEQAVVDWNPSNQGQLLAKFNWSQQGGVPSTLQVLYAQEDLWVLKNLMEIINKTNDGATERHKAYIRKIESIQIGREAAGRTGQITPVLAGGSGTMGSGTMGSGTMMPASSDSATMPMSSSEGMPTDGAQPTDGSNSPYGAMGGGAAPDPAENRYVDKDYKPLAASKIRSDVTTNPAEVYLAVAKRMPVRLVCTMDQRKIHKLIAECGNSPLTVEVRQVRIGGNAGKGGTSGSFGSGSGGMDSFSSMQSSGSFGDESSGDGSEYGGFGGFGGFGGNNSARAMAQSLNDITVEVYGIVYIYNPVNKKALGITEATDGSGGAQAGALTAAAGASAPR
jgi:hypothetical protein